MEFMNDRGQDRGSDPGELVYRILKEPPAPLTMASAASRAAEDLTALVSRCLGRNPAMRFAGARALVLALENVRLA